MAATSSATPTAGRREGSAKSIVAEQISQSVQSTSNLLHLMLQSSPSHAKLVKLPRNLLALTSTIKNTELALEQMPKVVSSLDAHVERGLQRLQWCLQMFCKPQGLSEGMQGFSGFSVKGPNLYGPRNYNLVTSAASKREFLCVPHLNTVSQLLSNMQSCHLKSLSEAHLTQQHYHTWERDLDDGMINLGK